MSINQDTWIIGVLGYPLTHSLSPLMHNSALQHLGINAVYLPFAVGQDRFPQVIQAAGTLNIKGFNVTIPYKEHIIEQLDWVSESAKDCGAVNTVVIKNGIASGYNTDGQGFILSLQQAGIEIGGLAVVLGAGGAARAIGFELARRGCDTVFVNRTVSRAVTLAEHITRCTGKTSYGLSPQDKSLKGLLGQANLLINTTPIGMFPDLTGIPEIDLELVNSEAVISDIVYNPICTRLLAAAQQQGFKTVDGLGMFINQGAVSFELFTGQKAPVEVMRSAVQKQVHNS
ncbi:MAG: shikimate dehydrogenase [Chitinophagales bacterium]